jgi:hypothetical protein
MSALTDPTFWLAVFTVAAIIIVTGAVIVALRHFTFRLLHWLATKIVALAPPLLGGWVVGLFRFFYAAVLLCGLTAFVLSLKIWRAPWPPSGFSDPILRSPFFWLTCLAVMTAFMLCIIVVGALTRVAVAFGLARLRNRVVREGR